MKLSSFYTLLVEVEEEEEEETALRKLNSVSFLE
jgi:hypothetical protein